MKIANAKSKLKLIVWLAFFCWLVIDQAYNCTAFKDPMMGLIERAALLLAVAFLGLQLHKERILRIQLSGRVEEIRVALNLLQGLSMVYNIGSKADEVSKVIEDFQKVGSKDLETAIIQATLYSDHIFSIVTSPYRYFNVKEVMQADCET